MGWQCTASQHSTSAPTPAVKSCQQSHAGTGAASFRRQGRLTVIREQMAERIEQLKSELESDAAAGQGRKQAARLRAATEREERCRKALVRLRELEIERDARKSKGDPKDKKGVRASTTDAEARVMKLDQKAHLRGTAR
jgi:hypothetical protein